MSFCRHIFLNYSEYVLTNLKIYDKIQNKMYACTSCYNRSFRRQIIMENYRELKDYILPERVLKAENVCGAENLIRYQSDIASFLCKHPCVVAPKGYIILDFGKEYQGGVKIIAQDMMGKKNANIRVRFGESAMECCSELGQKGSTNDHSVRDERLQLPWIGCLEYGMTGYRFIRVDNYDDVSISLVQVLGISVHSGKEYKGSFVCSDDTINRVWEASAYTLYLNNNKYITDGIKRDRLVWIGDMHPETISVLRLFGDDPSVRRSLDYIRDETELPLWMNGIPSYSMWWCKIQRDLYLYTGDKEYLAKQLPYIKKLCRLLTDCVKPDGTIGIDYKFIDWPSSTQPSAQSLGIRSLLVVSLRSCLEILHVFGDASCDESVEKALKVLSSHTLEKSDNKQAVSLAVFAELLSAKQAEAEILSKDPLSGLSTFLCYYVMQARAKAGAMQGALDIIRKYYGAMLDLGATTMWEDFDLEWAKNAKPIDALLGEGEYDVHGDNGGYCYKGYRHSLCHGWAAGTVSFATEYILGIKVAEVGCKKITVSPDLGDLQWAEGTFPTPYGNVWVRAEKKNGQTDVQYKAPEQVKVSIINKEDK